MWLHRTLYVPFFPGRIQVWLIALALVMSSIDANAGPVPEITARAAVLINAATGELLFAKEPYQPLPPASTTKVLTTLVALEHLKLNAKVRISPVAAAVEPSRLGLAAGEVLYVQDLLYGAMLKSGNDAAEAIAEAVGGSVPAFAALMNSKAWRLGARSSHFANPHGLPDPSHYSTAYDLALIFHQAMANPMFAEIVRTRDAGLRIESDPAVGDGWRVVPVHNSNRLLLAYAGVLGGKTGYTSEAKNCYVGEAERENIRLIVAVLGSVNRNALWQDVAAMFDYGFAQQGRAVPTQTPERLFATPGNIRVPHAPREGG